MPSRPRKRDDKLKGVNFLRFERIAEGERGDSSEDLEGRLLSHRRKFYLVRERLSERYRRGARGSALET